MRKYVWRAPVELYDLQTDPDEVVNLADDLRYADIRRTMSEKLLARLRNERLLAGALSVANAGGDGKRNAATSAGICVRGWKGEP